MKKQIYSLLIFAALIVGCGLLPGCRRGSSGGKQLTMAINSGVEGDALKQAAKDYEQLTGVHINIVELPYANLFEKELVAMQAKTGAYDIVMLDDPWFPKFAEGNSLTDLDALYKKRNLPGPDQDFVANS
ncbi:MAG: extracellular solute-binding protein, partial [Pyrinomonadaceae bacterium]